MVFCEKDGRAAKKRGNIHIEKEVGERGLILEVTLSKLINYIIQEREGE